MVHLFTHSCGFCLSLYSQLTIQKLAWAQQLPFLSNSVTAHQRINTGALELKQVIERSLRLTKRITMSSAEVYRFAKIWDFLSLKTQAMPYMGQLILLMYSAVDIHTNYVSEFDGRYNQTRSGQNCTRVLALYWSITFLLENLWNGFPLFHFLSYTIIKQNGQSMIYLSW